MGQAPALTDEEMLAHLRQDAKQLEGGCICLARVWRGRGLPSWTARALVWLQAVSKKDALCCVPVPWHSSWRPSPPLARSPPLNPLPTPYPPLPAESFRQGNKQAMLNVVSDGAAATVFFIILLRNTSERAILFRTIGRVFTGLSGGWFYLEGLAFPSFFQRRRRRPAGRLLCLP